MPVMAKLEKKLMKHYDELAFHEKWILSRLKAVSESVNKGMESFDFSLSGIELQAFTRNEFCDYYIEEFKITRDMSTYGNDVILYVLWNILKLWHPYIPYVTEELWSKFGFDGLLIETQYSSVGLPRDEEIEKDKNILIELIKEIRTMRADNNVMPNKDITLELKVKKARDYLFTPANLYLISGIVRSSSTKIVSKPSRDDFVYSITKSGIEIFLDNSNAKDMEQEKIRIKEQIADVKEYLLIINKKLLNENFVKNAPSALVKAEFEKKMQAEEKLAKLEEKLKKL